MLLVWWWQSQVVTKQKESLGRFTGENPALGHASLLCLCDLVLPCPEPALQVPSAQHVQGRQLCLLEALGLLYQKWGAAWVQSRVLWQGCDIKLRIPASFQLEFTFSLPKLSLTPSTCCCHSLNKNKCRGWRTALGYLLRSGCTAVKNPFRK